MKQVTVHTSFGDMTLNMLPETDRLELEDGPVVHEQPAMARAQNPDSASCQFFICLDDASFLDHKYSAFGQVADDTSLETLKKIGKVPTRDPGTGEKSAPLEPVKIDRMSVTEVSE